MPKTTKKTTQKTKKATIKTPKKATKTSKKSDLAQVPMKNFLILWGCIAAIVLLVVAVLAFLIPQAKALDRNSSSTVKHNHSLTVTEE